MYRPRQRSFEVLGRLNTFCYAGPAVACREKCALSPRWGWGAGAEAGSFWAADQRIWNGFGVA